MFGGVVQEMVENKSITACFVTVPSNTSGVTALDDSDDEAIAVGLLQDNTGEDGIVDGIGAI